MGPQQVLPIQRVDLGVMAMKGIFYIPKAPVREPHHQMQFGVIPRRLLARGWGIIPLRRCSQHILQPSPTNRVLKILVIYNCSYCNLHQCISSSVISIARLTSLNMKPTDTSSFTHADTQFPVTHKCIEINSI